MERQFLTNDMVHYRGTSSKLCIKEETVTAKSFSRWSGNIVDIHYELVSYFKGKVESFQADQLIKSLVKWKSLTSDNEILQAT